MNRSVRCHLVHLLIVPALLLLLLPAALAAGDDAELIDVKSSTISEEVTTEFLEKIPNGRIYLDAVSLVAGVAGLEESVSGVNLFYGPTRDTSFHVHGGNGTDNIFLVDGVETTNVATGGSGMVVPWEAIESVEVLTGGLPAEYGRATGGVVNVVTRSGGNSFHGSLPVHYTDHNLAQSQDEDRGGMVEPDFRDLEWGGSLGGPVVRDHLWFFAAYNRLTRTIKNATYGSGTIERDAVFEEGLLNLTWQINDDHKLKAQYVDAPTEQDRFDSPSLDVPSVMEAGDRLWKLEWTGILTPNLFIEARVAGHESYFSIGPKYAGYDDARFIDEQNGAGRIVSGNVSSIYDLELPRTQYRAALDWYVGDVAGDHAFTFGAEYQDLEHDEQQIIPDTFTINQPDGWDSWLQRSDTTWLGTGSIMTLFAQDDWTWRDDWTFNLGLRWEQQEQKNDVGERVYKFDNLISPRLGVAWDVQGDGRSKLFAHIGRYYQAVGLQLATALNRQLVETRHWDRNPETGEWELIGYTWPPENPNQADDSLDANYKDEVILGYEFEFATDFAAGARAIYNRQNNMIEDVLANEDEIRYSNTPIFIYNITNVESARRDYRGLELHLQKRLSNNYQFLTVLTLSESRGSVVYDTSAVGLSPYADFDEMKYNRYGNLPWDDKQYLKVNGAYHLPLGFIVGASLNWRSGQPYNRIDSDLPEGAGNFVGYNDQYYLDPRGSHRLGSAWWIDLRLRKDFEAGPTTISLTADAFNLTNNQTVTGRSEIYHNNYQGLNWGHATDWMRAGYFVLGGKLTF